MDNSSGLTANLYLLLVFQGLHSFIVFLMETVAGFFLPPDRSPELFFCTVLLHLKPSLDLLFQAPLSYSREGNKRLLFHLSGVPGKSKGIPLTGFAIPQQLSSESLYPPLIFTQHLTPPGNL